MKKLVVHSGGLDSTVLLVSVVTDTSDPEQNVHTITFNYGQRHSKELTFARWVSSNLHLWRHEVDLSFLERFGSSALTNNKIDVPNVEDVLGHPQPVTYVPNRNMMFLSIACACAESHGIEEVYYGAMGEDTFSGYWDCTPVFLEKMNSVLSLNRMKKIKIVAPFINLTKTDVVKLGDKLGVDFTKTWTCYKGTGKACGRCASCSNRIKAFLDAGMVDPINYEIEIPWW